MDLMREKVGEKGGERKRGGREAEVGIEKRCDDIYLHRKKRERKTVKCTQQ